MRNLLDLALSMFMALGAVGSASANEDIKSGMLQGGDLHCLALNIYFEARGEPMMGKIAVGHVVLNRVADERFPQQVCHVIRQGGEKRRHRCQFSWWCDGQSDRPRDAKAWSEAQFVAGLIRMGATTDPTSGALWYHATYVNPDWSQRLNRQSQIGKHIFYTQKPRKTPLLATLPDGA